MFYVVDAHMSFAGFALVHLKGIYTKIIMNANLMSFQKFVF